VAQVVTWFWLVLHSNLSQTVLTEAFCSLDFHLSSMLPSVCTTNHYYSLTLQFDAIRLPSDSPTASLKKQHKMNESSQFCSQPIKKANLFL
jgi:hypothetical protein